MQKYYFQDSFKRLNPKEKTIGYLLNDEIGTDMPTKYGNQLFQIHTDSIEQITLIDKMPILYVRNKKKEGECDRSQKTYEIINDTTVITIYGIVTGRIQIDNRLQAKYVPYKVVPSEQKAQIKQEIEKKYDHLDEYIIEII